jgi:hypothetical protein
MLSFATFWVVSTAFENIGTVFHSPIGKPFRGFALP